MNRSHSDKVSLPLRYNDEFLRYVHCSVDPAVFKKGRQTRDAEQHEAFESRTLHFDAQLVASAMEFVRGSHPDKPLTNFIVVLCEAFLLVHVFLSV